MYDASSGVALGIIPGSVKLVRKRFAITITKVKTPTAGIAGLRVTAKYGQLKKELNKMYK